MKLLNYDIRPYIQRKPTFKKGADGRMVPTDKSQWLEYIEWAVVWKILNENYDLVDFESKPSVTIPNTIEVTLWLDDLDYKMNYPIINGNAVISSPNQMDYHRAELRGFVKAAAKYTGLGLSLWMKDEAIEPVKEVHNPITPATIRKLTTIKALEGTWKLLSEDEQIKYKSLFSERRKEIEDGL